MRAEFTKVADTAGAVELAVTVFDSREQPRSSGADRRDVRPDRRRSRRGNVTRHPGAAEHDRRARRGTWAAGGITLDFGTATDPDRLSGAGDAQQRRRAVAGRFGRSVRSSASASSEQGLITGVFSNGRSQALGQIALATFAEPGRSAEDGRSLYTRDGQLRCGRRSAWPARAAGARCSGGTLEMSNVDLAAEFTNLIVAQRGFQANSRVITTSDEILQDLVNLKR